MIRPGDIPEVDEQRLVDFGASAAHTPQRLQHELCKIPDAVEACFPTLEKSSITHFFSCGTWSTHELVYYLLSKTGPADVLISVWSISEIAARLLIDMLDKGMITQLRAVLDYRSKNRHPAAHQLAAHSFSKLNTFPCHAKLTVITNDKWTVTVNGSANYTNNPRPEAGVIDTHATTAAFYTRHIEQMLENSNPFE
jgi:hypothetical protein